MVSSTYPELTEKATFLEKLSELNQVGIALSAEHNIHRLLEKILVSAKRLTAADGCTLYTVTEAKTLHFELMACDSLRILTEKAEKIIDIPLYLEGGRPNEKAVSAFAALKGKVVNIADVYEERGFDFEGPRLFDASHGYRTKSLLTCPMVNYEGEVIGVLQLINAYDPKTGLIVPFSKEAEELATSLASQAAIALSNQRLISDLKNLFDSLIRMIAEAIDEKSPSMGNHGRRVPVIAQMLAEAVNETQEGAFKEFQFNDLEFYQLLIAAFLHDAGKITTPDHILEKHAKLETVFNRFELIHTRFALLADNLKRQVLEEKLQWLKRHNTVLFEAGRGVFESFDKKLHGDLLHLHEDEEFLRACALGKEFVSPEVKTRIEEIALKDVDVNGHTTSLLTEEEVELLSIPAGNLSAKERKIIENHVVSTSRLLTKLSFPKDLKKVPEIAGAHHERMNGSGYPRKMREEEIPVEARILAIADVFEALSAPDRAYKPALPLSQVYKIMDQEVKEGRLDPELYAIFVNKRVGLRYAEDFLKKEQIDIE